MKDKKQVYFLIAFIIYLYLLVIATSFLLAKIPSEGMKMVSMGMVAFTGGILFQIRRLASSWRAVLILILISYTMSIAPFLYNPAKYPVNDKFIATWASIFIGFFLMLTVAIYSKKLTPRLTEGIVFMQSIAYIYWVADLQAYKFVFLQQDISIMALLFLLMAMFSVYHAFTHAPLSRKSIFILSLWSSLITLFFSIDYVVGMYLMKNSVTSVFLPKNIYMGLQYFLFGVSIAYIVQNWIMIVGLFSKKGPGMAIESHIERFSERQVKIAHSFFCLIFCVVFFGANAIFQVMSRQMAIWLAFVIFPYALRLYARIFE